MHFVNDVFGLSRLENEKYTLSFALLGPPALTTNNSRCI